MSIQGFHMAASATQRLGRMAAIAQTSSPKCVAPPYWGPIEPSDTGRRELVRRVRAIASSGSGSIAGDEQWHTLKQYALEHLQDVEPAHV
jgi:hypothetical protein